MEDSAKKPWDNEPNQAKVINQYKDSKGRFVSGKPVGRPPGAVNITTKEIRQAFADLIYGDIDLLRSDYRALSSEDRLKWVALMAPSILGRMAAIAISEGDQTKKLSTIIDWGGNEETTDTD